MGREREILIEERMSVRVKRESEGRGPTVQVESSTRLVQKG